MPAGLTGRGSTIFAVRRARPEGLPTACKRSSGQAQGRRDL